MSESELRDALFDAVSKGDQATFARLFEAQVDAIRSAFARWVKVPDDLRSNPQSLEAYANGLIAVAEAFERAGEPEFMALLRGDGRDNPLDRWVATMEQANSHTQAGRFKEVRRLLEPLLAEMNTCQGSAVEQSRPKVLGALGLAHFRLGDLINAERCMLDALEGCQQTGDTEGVAIYSQNLDIIASRKPTA